MKKQIILFLFICFGLSWGLGFWLMGAGGLSGPYGIYALVVIMMLPALSALITRLFTGRDFKHMYLKVSLRGGDWKWYLAAWLGLPVLIFAGAALYFAIFPSHLDLHMGYYRSALGESALALTDGQLMGSALIQLLLGVTAAPVLNMLPCLGEELGWQGFLMPRLCSLLGEGPANVLTGIIWGLWHAPVIMMGHNYGTGYAGYPWAGIGAMMLFCVFARGILGRLSTLAGSCWPAVIGHGALNGLAGSGLLIVRAGAPINPFIGPLPVGIIGGMGLILVGTFCIFQAFARPAYQIRRDIFIRF